jgi:hypothetical protein
MREWILAALAAATLTVPAAAATARWRCQVQVSVVWSPSPEVVWISSLLEGLPGTDWSFGVQGRDFSRVDA